MFGIMYVCMYVCIMYANLFSIDIEETSILCYFPMSWWRVGAGIKKYLSSKQSYSCRSAIETTVYIWNERFLLLNLKSVILAVKKQDYTYSRSIFSVDILLICCFLTNSSCLACKNDESESSCFIPIDEAYRFSLLSLASFHKSDALKQAGWQFH